MKPFVGLPGPKAKAWIGLADLAREPFRLFFPLAVLAGLIGILLWPLMLGGWTTEYPGARHARLMVEGFFGAFIFGFLGTSLPRLLETKPFTAWEVFPQAVLHLAATAVYASAPVSPIVTGDALFATELGLWGIHLVRRLVRRADLPPPGFVLMPMAFLCLLGGLVLDWFGGRHELSPGYYLLVRLLGYHAFVLLCVLGAGSFLLPRFLGLGVRQEYPTARTPSRHWWRAALMAFAAGALVIVSCLMEASGWPRFGAVLRAGVVVGYFWMSMPFERLRWSGQGVHWLLIAGLACVPLGILASGWWPGWRVALAHIELVSGFGLITLGVATRVVFGHSGQRARLGRLQPWLVAAVVLMVLGLISRISADFIPRIMVRHYIYAAVCWIGGLMLWAAIVLPKVLRPDPEG